MRTNQSDRLTLYLPKDLIEWVKKEARKQNRSINNFVMTILLKYKRETEVIKCISK